MLTFECLRPRTNEYFCFENAKTDIRVSPTSNHCKSWTMYIYVCLGSKSETFESSDSRWFEVGATRTSVLDLGMLQVRSRSHSNVSFPGPTFECLRPRTIEYYYFFFFEDLSTLDFIPEITALRQ